jgi:hypothetical protein
MSDHEIYLISPTIHDAWAKGMSYHGLHVYYSAPMSNCECEACDRGRLWERLEEEQP